MQRAILPLILTAHITTLLAFTHFCTDPDNPGIWAAVYYLADPFFFGLFAISFQHCYAKDSLCKSFLTVWGFMNIGRFIAYLSNYMGCVTRMHNFKILLASVALGTLLILISGFRHGTFKGFRHG